MGGSEEKFVAEAFASNWIAPLGANVTGFEKDISQYNCLLLYNWMQVFIGC